MYHCLTIKTCMHSNFLRQCYTQKKGLWKYTSLQLLEENKQSFFVQNTPFPTLKAQLGEFVIRT